MNESHAAAGSEKSRVALLSLIASFLLAVVKFGAALFSGSLGLMSEAMHSLLDFGATGATLLAVRYADRPADDEHTFGHAKMESIAALAECGLLFGVTAWIIYESVTRLIYGGHPVEISYWIFGIVLASIIIDWNRSHALQKAAYNTGSDALAADALHFRADMWSSMAVFAGLAATWAGFEKGDALAALIVSGFVAHAAWELGRQTLGTLLDAAPAGLTARTREIAEAVPGVLSVRQARLRPAGPTTFVDLALDVPRTMPSASLAALQAETRRRIREAIPNADITLATHAVQLDDETAFDKIMHVATELGASIHHVTVQDNDGRLAVSFDLEVDGDTPLAEAHDAATALEAAIRDGLGADVEVESHIEPNPPALLTGAVPPKATAKAIEQALVSLSKREKKLSDLHNIRIRQTQAGLFIHYHCRFAPETPVHEVHGAVDRIENALIQKVKGVARVVAHAEPVGHARHKL
ncbi:MAG: cation diffusion facilitator family transporter [Hyphomicrobiales bacterium]